MPETRYCQNCKQAFVIDEDDAAFYAKLGVPYPTWCPECRIRRRLTFRNERSLYKRSCDLCKKSIIAMYPENSPYTVYCYECWSGDGWDYAAYAKEYDFSKNFFTQFNELLHAVPRVNLEGTQNLNSPYTNYTWECKNCYLSASTLFSENVYYGKAVDKSRDCVDCTEVVECELCYGLVTSEKCHSSAFLINCRECMNSSLLFDCQNCQDCILSCNLRNKKYVVRNKQYSKEEYELERRKLNLESYTNETNLLKEFKFMTENQALHRFARLIKTVNSTGNNLTNTKDAKQCFEMYNLENVRYAVRGYNIKDSGDMYGTDDTELDYECVNNGIFGSKIRYSTNTHTHVSNAEYTDYCRNSSNLFGCAGVRNRSYCILNKQYKEAEYFELREKIIQHMNESPYTDLLGRVYRYGEFPPIELSPFAYNEAISGEYMPLTQSEAVKYGFRWKEVDKKSVQVTLTQEHFPETISEAQEEVLQAVLECAHRGECNEQCSYGFRLTPYEFVFYKKMNLPLPRSCSNCRHYERLRLKNPWKLYKRRCGCVNRETGSVKHETEMGYINSTKHFHGDEPCPNEFLTTFASERPEIVYCESCYQNEIT